jgi:glycolate oxidase
MPPHPTDPTRTDDLVRELRAAGDVITDPEIVDAYRRDQAAPGLIEAGTPIAVVRPTTTAEVQAAVRAARRFGAPIVPRGAGSGLSGGANAIDGGIVLSLERMNAKPTIDAAAMTATVEPGVINAALGAAAAEEGLWYAPDPGSWEFSTIGGNVATNAGGLCCVKYGVTRDALLELEAVLADGELVRLGHRTRKGVVGYDLAGLLCGSEGTLGVITSATVRLLLPPPRASTLAATFATMVEAGEAIVRIVRETRPAMLELMDRTTVVAVQELRPMGFDPDVGALLFARSDAGGQVGSDEIALMERICDEAGATLVVTSDDPDEGRMLTEARRVAFTAMEHRGSVLLDDVAVPVPAIPALLAEVERIAERHGVVIGTFGHAGDGNMHPTIVYDHQDPDEVRRAREAFDAIVQAALELGGTVSGEHGIGALKRPYLDAELGGARRLGHAIKHALDPEGLLNPGKAI